MGEATNVDADVEEGQNEDCCIVTSILKKRLAVTAGFVRYLGIVSRYENDGALFLLLGDMVMPAQNFCDQLTPEMEAALTVWSVFVSKDMAAKEEHAVQIYYKEGEDSPVGMSAFVVGRPAHIGIRANVICDIDEITETLDLLRSYLNEGKPIAFVFDREENHTFGNRIEKLLKRIVKALPQYSIAKQGTKTFLYYGMSIASDREKGANFFEY